MAIIYSVHRLISLFSRPLFSCIARYKLASHASLCTPYKRLFCLLSSDALRKIFALRALQLFSFITNKIYHNCIISLQHC